MKRSLSFERPELLVVASGTALIAGTYGLVRLAYGLFLPDVQTSIDLSDRAAGLISSGASAAYCAGALLGLTARTQARRLVVGATGAASLGALGMALAPDVATFAPAAVLASTGAGLASPAMVVVVARSVAVARRERGQAVVNTGTGPGLAAVGVLALVLLPHWRWGLVLSSLLTAIAGTAVLRASAAAPPPPTRTTTPRPRDAHVNLRAWVVPVTGALLLGTASAAVWTYGRVLLVGQGASDTGSVVAWIAIGVGGAAAAATAPALDRLSAQRAWAVSVTVVAATTAVLPLVPGATGSWLVCAGFGWSFVAATSALIAWATQVAPDAAGPGTAVLFVALVLGQAAGSSLVAAVAERLGLPGAFLVAGGVAVTGAAVPVLSRSRAARRSRRASSPTRTAGPRRASGPARRSTRC